MLLAVVYIAFSASVLVLFILIWDRSSPFSATTVFPKLLVVLVWVCNWVYPKFKSLEKLQVRFPIRSPWCNHCIILEVSVVESVPEPLLLEDSLFLGFLLHKASPMHI